ncbi:MAG: hypothetical protein KAI43_07595 [Candidatus Aureabacteria bacterium]|nr:hypothetical protein [Candidatus Auribacterota bacterium]
MARKTTKNSIDILLKYLPLLESPNFNIGKWDFTEKDSIMSFFYTYSDIVNDFIYDLYGEGFIIPYNWPKWQKEADHYYHDPNLIKSADIKTLQKILTLHVRKERFKEGHLGTMIEAGHIQNILKQLSRIRNKK